MRIRWSMMPVVPLMVMPAAWMTRSGPRPTFDITRSPNPHLTFGHGAHYCIGASLARIELQEVFTRIPARLPGLRLAVPRTGLRLRTDRLTGGLAELPLAW